MSMRASVFKRYERNSVVFMSGSLEGEDLLFYEKELNHNLVYTRDWLYRVLRTLPDIRIWNAFMCLAVLAAVVLVMIDDQRSGTVYFMVDLTYNFLYVLYVSGFALNLYTSRNQMTVFELFTFIADAISFVKVIASDRVCKLLCYAVRLNRPLQYLWNVNDFAMKGSVVGTAFKWMYMFLTTRVLWTVIRILVEMVQARWAMFPNETNPKQAVDIFDKIISKANFIDFQVTYYAIDKMFLPVGTPYDLITTMDQVFCMIVTVKGCLLVTGAAVASMSLVFSIYMMPEEAFRARYRLIMKELISSHIHDSLRIKVETFYNMYWKKQQAVSTADLLSKLPPSLLNEISTDIYFEAMQKSKILKDLPNYFITEVAKCFTTIHYIPGDTIIQRKAPKSALYYITYGDVALLTAEDDLTALLKFCRGTVLTPSAVCAEVACTPAHVQIQAATFCTAYVLRTVDLWKKALKQNKYKGMAAQILINFHEWLEKLKNHYADRFHPDVKYLSSIVHFRSGLAWLKESKTTEGRSILEHHIFLDIAEAYVMRNDYDICVTERSDPICLRTTFPCILQPTSSLLTAWNIVVTFFAALVTFTHPYYMAFKLELPDEFLLLDYVTTAIFTLDLIVNLSTGANVEEGQTITMTQTVSYQMRSPRFIFDTLAVAPIFNYFANGHYAGINKLIKMPKIFRFLRHLEEGCVYYSHIIRFLTYTLLVFITTFLLSTFNQGMMCYRFEMCEISNLTHAPHRQHSPMASEDTLNKRLYFNMYWAVCLVTITKHMSSFTPEYTPGVAYLLVVIEFVMLHHIFIEAVYSATVMVASAMKEDFNNSIRAVKDFMLRNNMNPIITKRFITYVQLCWYTDQAYSISHKKKSIFFDLPPHVYHDIIARQNWNYIKNIPFMKFVKKQELKYMASNTKLFYTSPHEILLNTGDMTNEIYVLKRGLCEIVCPITKKVVHHLKAKSHFGVPECLLRVPAFYTVRAVTHVQVFSIKQRHLKSILLNPMIKEAIEFAKKSREFSSVLKHHRMPFMTYEPLPTPPNREIFRLPKKYEQDNIFQQPFRQFGFLLQPLRYIFPRFTIRPDGKYLRRYEWFRAFCAFSCAMLFPSYTYLVIQFPSLWYLHIALDIFAYFDIIQRFLVGYYNSEGILVYHPASTSAHYIKTAFLVDLLGCLPLETLELKYGVIEQVMLSDQLLMINRLLQMYRFFMTLEGLSEYLRGDVLFVINFLPLYISLCNVVTACIVLCSVKISIPDEIAAGDPTWLIEPQESASADTDSWVVVFGNSFRFNLTESPWNIHLASYFWVISETTSTGFRSILPTHEDLMLILFMGMLTNKMLTTYFAVSVISCRSNVNRVLCKFQEDLRDLKKFMSYELVHVSLQRKILKYYSYNWEMMGGINSRTVLKMCCQVSLRTDTILQIYGPTFYECPILTHSDASLLRILSRGIYDLHFLRDTEILTMDDVISHMYFINRGSVTITGTFSDPDLSARLSKGSIFGNLDRGRIRIPMKVTATTKVHILQIDSDVFHEIIKDFPLVGKLMKKYRPNKECFISAHAGSAPASNEEVENVTNIDRNYGERLEYNDYKLWTKHPVVLIYLIAVSLTSVYLDTHHVGFQNINSANVVVLYILDLLFIIKIVVLLYVPMRKTTRLNRSDKNSRLFRRKYLKRAFVWDLLSTLPLEIFCLLAKPEKQMFYFAWLRLNRVFRIPTVYKSLNYFQRRMSINIVATTVMAVAIWFLLSMHIIACMWWYISLIEEQREPKSSWRFDDNGTNLCEDEYVCPMFFMVATLTHSGSGKILPRRQTEIIYMIFIQIISTVVYMGYVGEFSNIIQYTNFRLFGYYKEYLELKNYLHNNRISANLLQLVNRYALHLWRVSRGRQFPKFLAKAPPPLRLKIMSAIYHHHMDEHPVFKDCEPAFVRQVIGCFNCWAFVDEMFIVREHEITDTMYFIHRGTVKETSENSTIFKIYKAGEYFGQLQGLVRNQPFTNSYETITSAQILTLALDDWYYLLKFYPKSRAIIYGTYENDEKSESESEGTPDEVASSQTSLQTVFSDTSDKLAEDDEELVEKLSPYYTTAQAPQREDSYADSLITEGVREDAPTKVEGILKKKSVKESDGSAPLEQNKVKNKDKILISGDSDTTLTPYSEGATWARDEDKPQDEVPVKASVSGTSTTPGYFFTKATSLSSLHSEPSKTQTQTSAPHSSNKPPRKRTPFDYE